MFAGFSEDQLNEDEAKSKSRKEDEEDLSTDEEANRGKKDKGIISYFFIIKYFNRKMFADELAQRARPKFNFKAAARKPFVAKSVSMKKAKKEDLPEVK